MYYSTAYQSPLGTITIASDGQSIVGLWFDGQKYFYDTLSEPPIRRDNLPIFDIVKRWLREYFAGNNPDAYLLPLSPVGNEFRQRVWAILRTIPYGTVTTYGEIARKIAADSPQSGMSPQAVGGAVGHNPISIIIPCHRVVGATGHLTGYAGGMDTKRKLLELEGLEVGENFLIVSK
jgi:methylated-DNA-[protein]-cysteine S-methyltransferase